MDQSCCRREPKCGVDSHGCDYYAPSKLTKGEIHLGGIYEPHSPEPRKSLDPGLEEEEEDDGGESDRKAEERRRQCEMVMRKWSMEFLNKIPHPLAPCCGDRAATLAKKKLKDVEAAGNVTERIVEKFGGLTLGFSGRGKVQISGTSTGPQDPYNYQGPKGQLKNGANHPDPDDLRMKMVCGSGGGRGKSGYSRRPRRAWEIGYGSDSPSVTASFTPSFQSSRSSTRRKSKKRSSSGVKGQGDEREEEEEDVVSTIMTEDDLKEEIPPSSDDLILEYVEKYNLEMTFEYFLALSCLHTPDNPYQFISDLANRMIESRDSEESFSSLERIFHSDHVAAVFRMFDKEQNGFVTLKQYKTAMEVLGLVKYNFEPEGHDLDRITEETFVSEGTGALDDLLRSFLYVEPEKDMNN